MPRLARWLLPFALAGACTSAVARADEPAAEASSEERARVHFNAGVNLLRDPARPRYDEAYVEFKQAYALKPAPTILGNMALCALKLERDAEAIDLYTKYLEQATSLEADERTQIERDLATLKAGLARVTVTSRPDGAIIHDVRVSARGESITNVYGPIAGPTELGIRRGHHVMKAHFPGGAQVTWESDVNGGEAHVFEKPTEAAQPTAPDTPASSGAAVRASETRPVPPSVYVAGIATLALGAGAAVTGILAVDTRSRFDDANDGSNPEGAEDLRSSGRALSLASDVLLVGTILGAAATAYLYVTRPSLPATRGVTLVPGGVFGRF